MEIQITSRHEKATQSLQDTISSELEGLQKFYDRITSCHVVLDKERGKEIMEIVVHMAGHTVAATAKAENMGKAIDSAITKVERQLKKINEKIKSHKGKGNKGKVDKEQPQKE
jgi:putative sigma-54 modulation protein